MPVSSRFKEGLFPSFQSFDGAVFQSVHVKWNSRQEKQHRCRWVSCLCESNCNKADCHASWDSMPPLSSLFPSWKGVASVSEVLLPGWVWLILQQPTSSLQFPTASTLCGAAVMFELGKDQGAHKADSQATYIYNFSTWYVDNFRMVAIWVPPKLATWPQLWTFEIGLWPSCGSTCSRIKVLGSWQGWMCTAHLADSLGLLDGITSRNTAIGTQRLGWLSLTLKHLQHLPSHFPFHNAQGVHGAFLGHLSSYSFVLLAIFYMQCGPNMLNRTGRCVVMSDDESWVYNINWSNT